MLMSRATQICKPARPWELKRSWRRFESDYTSCVQYTDFVISIQTFKRKIWRFHDGDYEEWCLLGCYAVWLL
jgi:hypothetical protein